MTTWMIIFAVFTIGAFVIAAVQSFPQPERRQVGSGVPTEAPTQARTRRAMRVPEDRC